jgi:hypothetical protein
MESEYARRAVALVDERQHDVKRRARATKAEASAETTNEMPAATAVLPVATTNATRIYRLTAPTPTPNSKITRLENFAGQAQPDNPPKTDTNAVDNDEGEVEGEEVETTTSDSDTESSETESGSEETRVGASESTADLTGVHAVVRTGNASPTSKIKRREVKPTSVAPRVNNAGAGSDCKPDDLTDGDLTWSVVAKGKNSWGVKVTALRTTGQINVNPTPNQPTTKTAPNTPNPVDGGNIENNEGSAADWRAVLRSLKGYHVKGGGRGPWHDTRASTDHEWAHWNTDWMKNCLGSSWPKYRRKMEKLRVSKATYATSGAARTALAPLVSAKLSALDSSASKKWNKIPDTPGDFFANGYLAGEKILDKHIKKVESYATKKGWNVLGKVIKALTPAPAQGGAPVAVGNA